MSGNSKKSRRRKLAWKSIRPPKFSPPGTLTVDPTAPKPVIRVIAYGPNVCIDQVVDDPRMLAECVQKYPVTWVNVDGLGDLKTITTIGEIFGLHKLALEDVLHLGQRPKVDEYENHLYIVARMLERDAHRLGADQLSMFLGKSCVLTLQERPGDCLDAIRQRIKDNRGRIRMVGPDYLAYAILDAVVDEYFPVLETEGDRLEALEDDVLLNPTPQLSRKVHEIRRDLLSLRRSMWPMREAVNTLQRGVSPLITNDTRIYLRDCYDHTIQILDLIEVYRELSTGLIEMYMTSVSNRMNEIMKVLTIIATIFIPLTFVVGIYGMNFDPDSSPYNMPELRARYGYPVVMGLMAVIALGMVIYFWRQGWLRSSSFHPHSTDDEKRHG